MPPLAPTQTAQVSGTPMPNSPAPVPQMPETAAAVVPGAELADARRPAARRADTAIAGADVEAPNAQAPNLRTADVETVRNDVFGLAASGAVKALDEAKARPDAFSAVDIAQLEELSIRQQVRGGRDKSRSMTAPTASTGSTTRCARQTTSTSGYRPRPSTRRSGLRSRATGRSPLRHAAT